MNRRRLLRGLAIAASVLTIAGVGFVWWAQPGRYRSASDWELPTRYDADRFYAEPVAQNGQRLSFLTDTGGGLFLTRRALQRSGTEASKLPVLGVARLPKFLDGQGIPEPTGGERWMNVVNRDDTDGMLGQRWFAGGIWTFDYPGRKLILRGESFAPSQQMGSHAQPVSFRTTAGIRTQNHPRFSVTIDGAPIQCLFDTGATAFLTPEALALVADKGPSERATSFIAASIFDHWRQAHPTWRHVELGCKLSNQPMIEVPKVEVSGLSAGPVWFTRRSDGAMKWMSQFLDQPIVGSIGGSFLCHFRVTVDYINRQVYFEPEPDQPQRTAFCGTAKVSL